MPWLAEEIKAVHPALIVALGSTAAKALLGPRFLVTRNRGKVLDSAWGPVLPTVHPAAVLRARSPNREEARTAFFHDIEAARRRLR